MQLIIPAFNEEARLPHTLTALRAHVLAAQETGGALEVIVVDNASRDRTAVVAASFDSPVMPVRVVRCDEPGKGAAVRAGIAATTSDLVAFMDADGATDLDALPTAAELVAGGADVAIGSRAVEGSVTMERHSRVRTAGATLYRRLTWRLVPGIFDTQCGFKVLRGPLAREVFGATRTAGFSFDVEVLARAQRAAPGSWSSPSSGSMSPARPSCLPARDVVVRRAGRDRARLRRVDRLARAACASCRAAPRGACRCCSAPGGRALTRVLRGTPGRGRQLARPRATRLAGGSERYAWEFALGLREAGAEVDFLTAARHHQSRDEVVDGIRIRRAGRPVTASTRGLATGSPRVYVAGYDVVVDAENGIPVFAPLVVGRRARVLLVMHHVHQEQFRTYFPRPVADLGRFLEGWLMPRVYRHVRTLAVSDSTLTR